MSSLPYFRSGGFVSGALALLAVALTPAMFAQGALTPPGAPAPTMKSLGEIDASLSALSTLASKIESRIPIDTLPGDATAVRIISAPGSYFLRGNLSSPANGVAGIRVDVDGVVIDLNGYTLTGPGAAATANGIDTSLVRKRTIIRNGTLTGWYTGVNAGTYVLVENLIVENSRWYGVSLSTGSLARNIVVNGATVTGIQASSVESCRALNIVGAGSVTGISGSVVRDSHASFLKGTGSFAPTTGISGSDVAGCRVTNVESMFGAYAISAGRVHDCVVADIKSNAADATACGISGSNITGCNVSSIYGSGDHSYGIKADLIANCRVTQITSSHDAGFVYGISGEKVSDCHVDTLYGSPLFSYGISGIAVTDCFVAGIEPDAGTSYGIRLDAGGLARGNIVSGVTTAGIVPGIQSIVANNLIRDLGAGAGVGSGSGVGILVSVSHCRIQENSVVASSSCDYGIRVTGGQNFLIGNRCSGTFGGASTGVTGVDTPEFNIVGGNRFGSIVSTFLATGEITALNPWANFSD